jgi:hypothetical protein
MEIKDDDDKNKRPKRRSFEVGNLSVWGEVVVVGSSAPLHQLPMPICLCLLPYAEDGTGIGPGAVDTPFRRKKKSVMAFVD